MKNYRSIKEDNTYWEVIQWTGDFEGLKNVPWLQYLIEQDNLFQQGGELVLHITDAEDDIVLIFYTNDHIGQYFHAGTPRFYPVPITQEALDKDFIFLNPR